MFFISFFFSSRRRHTRFSRDWSSDVCSSDLDDTDVAPGPRAPRPAGGEALAIGGIVPAPRLPVDPPVAQRFIQRLIVGEAGRLGRALPGEHQPDPGRG